MDDPRGAAGPAVDRARPVPGDPAAVGPYRVLGRLGAGGMGTVYLAQSPAGARVAVKVIRPELAGDAAFLDRFRREVEAARRVAGFCTARVLDANLQGPAPYLVTEYVEGLTLDLVVERHGPLGASNLEGLAVGVAAACAAIHAAGLVHRDLKPANVLLSYFGPRVIDFGIARALDDASAQVTRAGTVVGTPAWMAPEQLAGAPVTTAADVFAWGGLVAYAGTGRPAFGAGPAGVLAYRIAHQRPDLGGLDGTLRPLVERAMAKDPALRPSARGLLAEMLGDADPASSQVTRVLRRTWAQQPTPPAPPPGPRAPAPGWTGSQEAPGTQPAPARASGWGVPPPPGTRPPGSTRGVVVALVIVVLAALAALNHGGDGGSADGATDRSDAGTPGTGSQQASRGDGPYAPVRDGKFEFRVTSFHCGPRTLGSGAGAIHAQGRFCLLAMRVRDVGQAPQDLDGNAQRLYAVDGSRYQVDGGATVRAGSGMLFARINPGNSVSGTLVYDVPQSFRPFQLELHDSAFSRGVRLALR